VALGRLVRVRFDEGPPRADSLVLPALQSLPVRFD
jgi:hypothetical protein